MGITKLQIGGIVAVLCVIMFIVALGVDQLLVKCPTATAGVTGTCGWEEVRFSGGDKELKHKWKDMENEKGDKLDQEIAGDAWLGFGILTVLIGIVGSVIALVPKLAKFKIIGLILIVVAGIFGIIGSAFALSGECAKEYSCEAGASPPLGLFFGIMFFVAAVPIVTDLYYSRKASKSTWWNWFKTGS